MEFPQISSFFISYKNFVIYSSKAKAREISPTNWCEQQVFLYSTKHANKWQASKNVRVLLLEEKYYTQKEGLDFQIFIILSAQVRGKSFPSLRNFLCAGGERKNSTGKVKSTLCLLYVKWFILFDFKTSRVSCDGQLSVSCVFAKKKIVREKWTLVFSYPFEN